MTRAKKIENAIAEWFRLNTDFEVSSATGAAEMSVTVGFGGDNEVNRSLSIDLPSLANEIDDELDRILREAA